MRMQQLSFFVVFVVVVLLITSKAAVVVGLSMAKPDCQEYCGNIRIPFPFGIGDNCYMNKWFQVVCNTISNSQKAFLSSINVELLDISFDDNIVRVNGPIQASNCSARRSNSALNLTGSPFMFSSLNRFTAMGCNNRASLTNIKPEIVGCLSTCNSNSTSLPSCSGNNCCQTTIPARLQVFDARFEGVDPIDSRGDQCKLAFIVEEDWFLYNITSPREVQQMHTVPVLLDWIVRLNKSKTDSYGIYCSTSAYRRSQDTSSFRVYTYPNSTFCSCDGGYEGNPYLPDGCVDVNQCEDPRWTGLCPAMTKCVNQLGFYKCELDKSKIAGLVIGVIIGVLLLIGGLWKSYKLFKKRKNKELRKKFFKRNGGLLLQQQLHSRDGAIQKTKVFSSKELDKATDRFNDNRVLGQGGQGTVYKGMLSDGRIVAVKKSKIEDEEKVEEFINEVVILSQINHRNVVKLLGCCLETEVPLLVYEFISNGNLFQYLHDQNEEFQFPWEMRLRLATEVAEAVSYLHSAASIPIYHRDIKSTNILLDERYRAKVSDFGASRSISIDQTHLTTHVQGTFGYLDPEYFQSSQLTEKSDVYSFGVVLLELISGQKPISFERLEERRSLATHFILLTEEGRLLDILDDRLMEECRAEVIALAKLAKKCLNLNGRRRPTMKEVTIELERICSSQKRKSENKNGKELESVMSIDEERDHWDDVRSSMTSNFDNPKALSIDIEPLIPLNTW